MINNFSENLKFLRKHYGYTQELLAKLIFVNREAISKWENNINFPNIDCLFLISRLFNISIDDLVLSNIIDKF